MLRLELEALLQRLRSCGARGDDEDYISELFAAWAAPGIRAQALCKGAQLLHIQRPRPDHAA